MWGKRLAEFLGLREMNSGRFFLGFRRKAFFGEDMRVVRLSARQHLPRRMKSSKCLSWKP
jgi:hypothetical protein